MAEKKRKIKWVRKSMQFYPKTEQRLKSLVEQYPFMSENFIVNVAIMNLDLNRLSLVGLSQSMNDPDAMVMYQNKAELRITIAEWCEEFGASIAGSNAHFNKYELTPAGQVTKNRRAMSLDAMPEDKDEVRKIILGPYHSVEEAEEQYNIWVAEHPEAAPKDRTIKAKMPKITNPEDIMIDV